MPGEKKKNIIINDFAENDLDAFFLYESRKIYKNEIYPKDDPKPIDFWNDVPFYGKVDQFQDFVFVSETNLRQLPTENNTLFAVDFVIDAYNDFLEYYNSARLHRKLKDVENSLLVSMEPYKGWESVNSLHHEHMTTLYELFVRNYLLIDKRHEQIKSFKDFYRLLLSFLRFSRGRIPITRSGFIGSRFCTPMISGLIIEHKTLPHSEDETKIKDFIQDPNFDFYRIAARRFGFMIDKNAPWRMVADVSSPRMQKYMKKYGIKETHGTSSDLFEVYYYQAFILDIDILKKYMLHMYNSFVNAYPVIKQIKTNKIYTTLFSVSRRNSISEDVFLKRFGDMFWLKSYFEIKVCETRKKINKKILDNKVKNALELYNVIDIKTALKYINKEVRISIEPSNKKKAGENVFRKKINTLV